MTSTETIVTIATVVSITAAVLAATTKHIVHAAIFLIITLAGVAITYLMLGAEVVALVQILIYIGATVVLILFAMMMTHAPTIAHDDLDNLTSRQLVGAGAGIGVAGIMGAALMTSPRAQTITPDAVGGSAKDLGEQIFTSWALPFEALSFVLLAALVGAIVVAAPGAKTGLTTTQPPTPSGTEPELDQGTETASTDSTEVKS